MAEAKRAKRDPKLTLPSWRRTQRFEVEATVVEHRSIIGNEFEIVFHAQAVAESALPGQFVEVLFGDNYAPLVRRPFSLYRVDRDAGTCAIIYLARGSFTSGLSTKKPGDRLSLLGPLGRPFHMYDEPEMQHILVAGGLGAPPIHFLASELVLEGRVHSPAQAAESTADALLDAPIVVINAARTESLLVGMTEFGELDVALHVLTDDGSRGVKGMATDLLITLLQRNSHRSRALYACGPMPMLQSVGQIAIEHEYPCQLSIETAMPCGIGLCQGCAAPIHSPHSPGGIGYALACVDGPIFEARDLVWGS